ncbi:MAG: metalloregulator ArsR/SmtB family transcription factor [Polyangiales bacterium]
MKRSAENTEETRVWKALGDPTRRALLELLREGPVTTGGLCERFEMTRYGVMKHLDVLEAAGLLLVKREGRQRFNHLNAVPLQRLVRRFVRGFAEADASRLLDLEQVLAADSRQETQHESQTMSDDTNLSFHIVQEITYAAPKEKVWAAITGDIAKWWGFHIGPNDSDISLDGRVGGLFIERWGDGEGELYGTVTHLRKGKKITLEGGMGLRGPGVSKYSFELEDDDAGTKFTLNHYCHGTRDADTQESFREGWNELLTKNLKKWVEDGEESKPA